MYPNTELNAHAPKVTSTTISFSYNTNEGVYNAVGQLTQSSSDPRRFDLVGTLNRIRTEVFQAQNGDREGVPNAVILITDTNSGQNSQLVCGCGRYTDFIFYTCIECVCMHIFSKVF